MRFAVYFTPSPDAALARVGSAWLGRDAFDGVARPHPSLPGLPESRIAVLTAEPRRYGLHATLKAPFRLAPGRDPAELRAAFAAFRHARPGFVVPRLRIARIGPFFALVAAEHSDDLRDLADAAVETFEPFRAPLTPAEVARRRPERLTDPQRDNLERWGYPYVFDDFLFHMTLTGPVPADEADQVETVLEALFAPILAEPLAVDGIALFTEASSGADFVVDTYGPLTAPQPAASPRRPAGSGESASRMEADRS